MGGIVTPEKFDYFHELILTQEIALTAARGYGDGLGGGVVIGLPPGERSLPSFARFRCSPLLIKFHPLLSHQLRIESRLRRGCPRRHEGREVHLSRHF
jgi:hypothetical protein